MAGEQSSREQNPEPFSVAAARDACRLSRLRLTLAGFARLRLFFIVKQ